MEDLEILTNKILKSSKTFTSDDFIKAYNIIYLHCTESTQTYEIKGSKIYLTLTKILSEYFKTLRPISSVQGFYELNQKLEQSFLLLERVYFYIERFYINVNIRKRGINVVHLRTLFYDLLYKQFMFSRISNIEEYFIYEICALRNSNLNEEDLEKMRKNINYLKDIFFFSENREEYENFVEMYYKSFNPTVDEKIEDLIMKVSTELTIAKSLFCFSDKESYLEITKFISINFKKILNWFFSERKKILYIEKFKQMENILYYMDDTYVSMFFTKLENVFIEYLESLTKCEAIFDFFFEFSNTFGSSSLDIEVFKKSIQNKIIKILQNFEGLPDVFSKLIVDSYKNFKNANHIFFLINELNQKNTILKRICQDCLERIINDTTLIDLEIKMFKICERFCGLSSVSWLILILQNYKMPLEQDFGLSEQEENLKTEFRLITKGFCNLEVNNYNLHGKLSCIRDILVNRIIMKYPRSEIACSGSASYIIFEMFNVHFRMSTDKVSMLLYINDENNIEKVKSLCKDSNFELNLFFLEKYGFVICSGDSVTINDDINIIQKRCIDYNVQTHNNVIDLFQYKIREKIKSKDNNEGKFLAEIAIESRIVKFMKKHKKSTLDNLKNELRITKDVNLNDFIEKLVTKGYIEFYNDVIVYVP